MGGALHLSMCSLVLVWSTVTAASSGLGSNPEPSSTEDNDTEPIDYAVQAAEADNTTDSERPVELNDEELDSEVGSSQPSTTVAYTLKGRLFRRRGRRRRCSRPQCGARCRRAGLQFVACDADKCKCRRLKVTIQKDQQTSVGVQGAQGALEVVETRTASTSSASAIASAASSSSSPSSWRPPPTAPTATSSRRTTLLPQNSSAEAVVSLSPGQNSSQAKNPLVSIESSHSNSNTNVYQNINVISVPYVIAVNGSGSPLGILPHPGQHGGGKGGGHKARNMSAEQPLLSPLLGLFNTNSSRNVLWAMATGGISKNSSVAPGQITTV